MRQVFVEATQQPVEPVEKLMIEDFEQVNGRLDGVKKEVSTVKKLK